MPPSLYGKTWKDQIKNAQDALAKLSPLDYLVEPTLYRPSLNLWYGQPGSHKTNLLIDAAVSVATGSRWLEGQPGSAYAGFRTVETPVLWVDMDSGDRTLHERFGAFLRVRKAKHNVPLYWASFLSPAFAAIIEPSVLALIDECMRLKVGMLVIDNLGTSSGGAEENSSAMIQVMSAYRLISVRTNTSVNIIHHDPKHMGARRTPRGHSSIEAAVDTAFAVDRDGDVVNVWTSKLRGAPIDPFSGLFAYTNIAGGRELETARFWGVDGIPDPISAKAETLIITHLRRCGSCNQADIVQVLRGAQIGRNRALTEISRMVRVTVLKEIPGQAHNQTFYSL